MRNKSHAIPPGFERLDESLLILPSNVANHQKDICLQKLKQKQKQKQEQEQEQEQERLRSLEETREVKSRSASSSRIAEQEMLISTERKRRLKLSEWHRLYKSLDLQSAITDGSVLESKDTKVKKHNTELFEHLIKLGEYRRLAKAPRNWRDELAILEKRHPNFREVTQFIAGEFALAEATKSSLHLPPLLLDGPPGVGKTSFASHLATILGSGFLRVSMESTQTSTALTGSEEHWSNSKPGQLFKLLVSGTYANPVVLIDELDKAKSAGAHDPASGLYILLEPSTAKSWFDLAFPSIAIDATKVVWIITANNRNVIPSPLLSRMRIFEVPSLTKNQTLTILEQVFAEKVKALGSFRFDPMMPDKLKLALVEAELSPRQMHRVGRELIATAVLDGRRHVLFGDLKKINLNQHTHKNRRPSIVVDYLFYVDKKPPLH